jgi:hypothetical protein
MTRLDKETSRRRWCELVGLWNEYDPIGVMDDPDWPRDEYESYVGQTLRRLEKGATPSDIVAYLAESSAGMGLEFDRASAEEHAARFVDWYRRNWRDTTG